MTTGKRSIIQEKFPGKKIIKITKYIITPTIRETKLGKIELIGRISIGKIDCFTRAAFENIEEILLFNPSDREIQGIKPAIAKRAYSLGDESVEIFTLKIKVKTIV